VGCSEQKENTSQRSNSKDEELHFSNLLTYEEWESFLLEIKDKGVHPAALAVIYGRSTMQDSLDKAAETLGFSWTGGISIQDHKGFKTIGGLSFYEFNGHYLFIYKFSVGRIDLNPVWSIKDVLIVSVSDLSFGIGEAKTDEMGDYNKEMNIWGIFDWDSPLIKPDVYIPAEKVIIVDIDTSTISVDENKDGRYKVFIDAAFLE